MRRKSSLSRRICEDLEGRGVPAQASDAISDRLAERAEGLDLAGYDTLLDGAAAAWALQSKDEEPEGQGRELQEIERLMGSFAVELSKLDEVLEVLAAHVRRMRTNSERTTRAQTPAREEAGAPRILH